VAITRLSSARDFFRVWYFWKRKAWTVFFLTLFIIMSFSYLYTPDYESTAKIMLLPKTSEGMAFSTSTEEVRVAPVGIEDINSEIEMLISDDVLRATVSSFMNAKSGKGIGLKIRGQGWLDVLLDYAKLVINEVLIFLKLKERISPFESNVETLRNALEVEPIAMSAIILVTLQAERPKAAEVVLNRLLDIYIQHHTEVLMKEEGLDFFNDQAVAFYKNLDFQEQKLQDFQKKWNIVDLQSQNAANIALLSDLKKSLQLTEISYEEAKSRIQLLQSELSKNKNDILRTKEMRTIPSIVELEENIVPLLVRRSEIKKSYTTSSREYRDIIKQIETLKLEIINEILKAIKTDQLELNALAARKKSIQQKIHQLTLEANDFNQKARTLRDLQRQIQLYNTNYMLYASKTEDARIIADRNKRDLANVSLASKASLPVKPVFPNRILMLAISVIIGLFAAVGTPFLLEFIDHRVKTPNDIEKLLDLPVVCSLPEAKN